MNKKTILISLLGIAALVIPVVLLILFSNKSGKQPEVASGDRNIDPKTVQDVVSKIPTPAPIVVPSPSSATGSGNLNSEGSPSAQ